MYIKYLFIIINLSKKYSSRDTIPLKRKKSDLKRGDGEEEMKEKTRSRQVELERQRKKDVYCRRGSRNKIRKAEMKRPEQRFDGVTYRKGTSNGSGAWLKILRIA